MVFPNWAGQSSSLIERAMHVALLSHTGQTRKNGETPYIFHPLMVGMTLQKYGFRDEVIAAGIVHDVLEDTDVTAEQLTQYVGEEVVKLVVSVSEDKTLPYNERKAQYREQVARAGEESLAISLADKLYNLRNMLESYRSHGDEIWGWFNCSKDEKIAQVHHALEHYQEHMQHPLLEEYRACVAEFDQAVR